LIIASSATAALMRGRVRMLRRVMMRGRVRMLRRV